MNEPYHQILRVYLHENGMESRLQDVLRYCHRTGCREVLLFTTCYDDAPSFVSLGTIERYMGLLGPCVACLRENGITVGVNVMQTLGHIYYPQSLQVDFPFQRRVYSDGAISTAGACPLCRNLRNWVSASYELYAGIQPRVLFVDDDFRTVMGGGISCFCDLHMERIAEMAGRKVSREEVVTALDKDPTGRLGNAYWEVTTVGYCELAERIQTAVHGVSPKTRLGVMTAKWPDGSVGMDWARILKALCGSDRPLLRPQMMFYSEGFSRDIPAAFSNPDCIRASLPADIEFWPEIENYPFGEYSKSAQCTFVQMSTALLHGFDHLALDIVDVLGSPFSDFERARTEVDARGHWLLRLPPLPAGGPHELKVEAPSGHAEVNDLLVGEVWICSGQSNMEWKLEQCGPTWMVDTPDLPQVRLLTVTTPARLGRADSVDGSWKLCTPEALAEFSAAGGYFGRELHRALGVPIGLICNAWGGSRVQAWLSREALMQDPAGRVEVGFYESYVWQTRRQGVTKTFNEWERTDAPQDPGNLGLERGWTGAGFDDSSWPGMTVPGHWNKQGHPHSGIFWFRRTEQVPVSWVGRDLELSLGAIDKHDETWVNGELVGSMGWETPDAWSRHRVYPVPGHLIGPDRRVVIAVRARSHVYDGGITGPASLMRLYRPDDAEDSIPLAGQWRYAIEHDWGMVVPPVPDWGTGNPNSPHILFDNRLAPLIPYGLRGAIWYQGESNTGEADLYRRMLPLMIRDWRRAWGQGDFPFLQVQLANFGEPARQPAKSQWAELREAQLDVLAEPATGMAVAVDVGEAYNIHPQNKRDVGLRLAQWALSEIHGRDGIPSGPLFSGMRIEAGGRVRCSFRHVGKGLVSRGGELRHFALAGKDRVFYWAEAVIEGETVVVRGESVPEPMAVRYAWADNPEGCNLYDQEGLPASPFRSDSWTQ